MRRIATGLALLAAMCCGCQQMVTPWSRPLPVQPDHPLDEPEVRTKRDAVPDEIMLPSQARGGFNESPSGP